MSAAGPAPDVVVAVVTYRRPDDLAAALPAVLAQAAGKSADGADGVDAADVPPRARVLVVDNDPDGSAEAVVRRLGGGRVEYVVEPTPGIAAARNTALRHAVPARSVVFLDDDETPEPGWLDALLATARRTGAAAVAGPVVSVFDVPPDPWVRAGRFFDRRRLPTGTPITMAATNNLLLDLDQVGDLRFDETFGLTGGSDTLFTRTLARSGRRLVWCDEAVVLDRVPAGRVTREWVLRRAFRMSNTGVRVDVALAGSPRGRLAARAHGAALGAVRVVAGGLRVLLGVATGSAAHRAGGSRRVARGLGMLAAAGGWVYAEYARGPRRRRGATQAGSTA